MKHLYKTKEGDILEARDIDFENNLISLTNKEHNIGGTYNLSEVQEVVLDKDGEPFMFEGEVVCVGDEVNDETVFDWQIFDGETYVQMGSPKATSEICLDSITSHTPKHPQRSKTVMRSPEDVAGDFIGIEKIEVDSPTTPNDTNKIAEKLNEIIDVVNKIS